MAARDWNILKDQSIKNHVIIIQTPDHLLMDATYNQYKDALTKLENEDVQYHDCGSFKYLIASECFISIYERYPEEQNA